MALAGHYTLTTKGPWVVRGAASGVNIKGPPIQMDTPEEERLVVSKGYQLLIKELKDPTQEAEV